MTMLRSVRYISLSTDPSGSVRGGKYRGGSKSRMERYLAVRIS